MSESSSSESSYGRSNHRGESSESSYSYSDNSSSKRYSQPYDDNNYTSSIPEIQKPNVNTSHINSHVNFLAKQQDSLKPLLEKISNPIKELTEEEKKKARIELTKIKKKLKSIEDSVTENFSLEEKQLFVKTFRDIIMNNEDQVILFPNASFFISKFENSDRSLLNENFKEKILKNLHEIHMEEKQNNSKLKYWK